MHKLIFDTKNGKITVSCENGENHRISFAECFRINFNHDLPAPFVLRGEKVFCSKKLSRYDNIVYSIECIGDVNFRELKQCIPSIFDIKHINRLNYSEYFIENINLIIEISSEILDRDEVLNIIDKYHMNR